ncbi:sensor domain-containing protein [Rhodococcus sp. X156]|uniref:sensor histidine kinase n=1 Tax=Rhodococcus sp. X156 TaxID=2499145 RepID=UPI000FD778A2|nr:sensor domain-containing protein [Rhodococcus sp. X156]
MTDLDPPPTPDAARAPARGTGGRPTAGGGVTWRLRLSLLALAYVFLAVPALVLLVVLSTALGLAVVGVGLVLLLLFVPQNRQLAQLHRRLAGTVLGRPVETPDYLTAPRSHPWALLRTWARDPARWRDYLWTWVSTTLGWALAWIALALPLTVVFYLVAPFLYAVTPDGVFETNYSVVRIDSQAKAFLEWSFLLVAGPAWWYLLPVLVRWRAQLDEALLSPSRAELQRRVAQVSRTRTESIDHSASELRRIERDLHDGAQARLVSLGMNLGIAEQLWDTDPAAAARLVAEARGATVSALGDLRSVVRGIHPPVLADRGLAGAVEALALDMATPISVFVALPGRPPAPVESAVYFGVAECLANLGKHSGATRASVTLSHDGARLRAVVVDDGRGGARAAAGGGLAGVARRLAAFDGTMDVQSPAGGPTAVTMELPCALSSPRTTPSSGTD